jgi:hypothetical protein
VIGRDHRVEPVSARQFARAPLAGNAAFMAESDIVKQDAKESARRTRHETTLNRH